MFNSGDTVEEIATGRRGTIALSGRVVQPTATYSVHFIDGKQPLMKDFVNVDELRLIASETTSSSPRLVPKTTVV
jgi:hypothetical protein